MTARAEGAVTMRDHFNGHCCASDPECEHSFLELDELEAHLDSPYDAATGDES